MGTNAVTGEVSKGREAKYSFSEAHSKPVTLTQVGKDGKTYTVQSVEYTVSNIQEALEVNGASEDQLFASYSDFLTLYAQRSDRSKLSQLAQGPTKIILRSAKDFLKAGFAANPAEAIDEVLSIGIRKGTYTQEYSDANKADLVSKLEKALSGKDDEDAE